MGLSEPPWVLDRNGKSERADENGVGSLGTLRQKPSAFLAHSTQSPEASPQELPGHTQEGAVVFEWSHGGWGSGRSPSRMHFGEGLQRSQWTKGF